MDKKAWFAVTLSIIGIFAWQYYVTKNLPQPAPAPATPANSAAAPSPAPSPAAEATTATTAAPAAAAASPAATPAQAEIRATPAAPAPAPVAATTDVAEERIETVKNAAAEIHFTNRGGGIANVALLEPQHTNARGGQIVLNEFGRLPIGSLVEKPGSVEGSSLPYETRREGASLIYERTNKDGLKVTKRFTPAGLDAKEPLVTDLEITFTNTGATTYRDDGLYLNTGSASPIHASEGGQYTGFDWLHDSKHTEALPGSLDGFSIFGFNFSEPKNFYLASAPQLMWAGVKNQFYTTMVTTLASEKPADQMPVRGVWANRFLTPWPESSEAPKPPPTIYGMAGAIGLPALKLEAGASQTLKFRIYTGPRSYDRLKALGRGEEEMMNFGMFKIFSVFLLASMTWLKNLLGNYALAIVVLTILIKIALWPLQSKAIKAQKKMSLLAPKMKELQEKYKDDPTRLNTEVMQMYKDYGVSPVGGCLPTVAQMPIFFGFYYMLGTAVELRNSSFLWVKDLTQPDTIAHLNLLVTTLPLNPLPLLMAGTMFWQMAITPKTGDPKQQRIFMLMPLMFIVFCYNFASALALYWTIQNLLSVLQTYLTRHQPLPALVKKGAEDEKPAKARVVSGPGGAKRKAMR